MKIRNSITYLLVLAFTLTTCFAADSDVEKLRDEQIKKWGTATIPKPKVIAETAKSYLEKPLEEQKLTELKTIAEDANRAANYVDFIFEEYAEYYRDNYRYDFVQEKVAPYHDNYVRLVNQLKDYRNKAYFNIGKKLAEEGNEVEAFFYFRDAFRLSTFTEDSGDHKGIRYMAEQEMKKMMEIESIESFLYWK
ncbi:MAG: hypothetical protein AAF546_07205 [Verrucomicrobiota bacterium]